MKSILQSIALASAVILIASCDSSSGGGGGSTIVVPTPVDGVAGSGVKGIIDGGTVTVVDADGDQVASTLTTAGQYSIVYDAAAVAAGVSYPVTVTISNPNGTATTICDFQNEDNSGNDCRTLNDTFVGFGTPYTLALDFTLVALIDAAPTGSDPTSAVHISPATDIVATLAGTAPTVAALQITNAAIGGLIQSITGIDLGGVSIEKIATADVTGTGASTATGPQLALAAFASAIVAQQQAGESLSQVIARFASYITITEGNATGSATNLSILATALSRALTVIAANTGSSAATAGASNAASNAAVFTSIATGCVGATDVAACELVKLPPNSVDPTGDNLALTRVFVGKLSTVIGSIAATTGANGTDPGVTSVTEAFASELDALRIISDGNATKAFTKLSDALNADAALITADATLSPITNAVETADDTTDDGIEYVLTSDGSGGFTVTDVSSRWPLTEGTGDDANTVTITGATGTADSTGVSIPAITMTTTRGADTALITLQVFTGDFTTVNGASAGLYDSVTLNGSVVGQTAGTSFTLAAALADVDDTGNATDGTYTLALGFTSATADDFTISFSGTLGNAAQNFTVAVPTATITGSVVRSTADTGVETDVNIFTDGTASLTLAVVDGVVVVGQDGNIGVLSVGTDETLTTTGTVDSTGLITYSDGTIQSLPAVIF